MTSRSATPSQTVGPFFHDCLLRDDARCDTIVGGDGDAQIRVEGRVLDGAGAAAPDAVIEVWHAAGFARLGTDEDGRFSLTTVRPERMPYDRSTMQAPHLSVAVFARGLMNHLFTRIYLEDEPSNVSDPILRLVPDARRATLIAKDAASDGLTQRYRFDIVLQGEGETVFFDFKAPVR